MPTQHNAPLAAQGRTSGIIASGAERGWNVALRAKGSSELEIAVYDVIGQSFWGDGISSKDFLAKLRAAPEAKKISLRVNSVGGVVDEAKAMVNLLLERAANGVEIVATVDGLAASSASYLLTAASRVEMPANAFQMVHGVRGGARGTAGDLEEAAALFRRLNDQLAEAYAAASERRGKKKTKQSYLDLFAAGDTYLDADQAIEYGLADSKIENLKAAACLADIADLSGAPEELRSAIYVRASLPVGEQQPAPIASREPQSPAHSAVPPVAANTTRDTREGNDIMKMISLAAVAAALGMTAGQIEAAEERDVLDAVGSLKKRAESPSPSVAVSGVQLMGVATEAEASAKIQEFQRGILQILGAAGKASVPEAVVTFAEWKEQASHATALTKQVGSLTEECRVAKRDAAIEKMSRDGFLPPSRHEWARAQFATAESVETFCAGMPKGFFNGIKSEVTDLEDAALTALTAEEKTICKVLGMTEAKYLEEKKLLRKAS